MKNNTSVLYFCYILKKLRKTMANIIKNKKYKWKFRICYLKTKI